MSYHVVLVTLHLLAAFVFVGGVFFEVLVMGPAVHGLPKEQRRAVELGIAARARRVMPWVLLTLYGAGIAMALTTYRALLAEPFASTFATLLWVKIILATSVFGHFVRAMTWRASGKLTAQRFHRLHVSLFFHMLAIVIIAKTMMYW